MKIKNRKQIQMRKIQFIEYLNSDVIDSTKNLLKKLNMHIKMQMQMQCEWEKK